MSSNNYGVRLRDIDAAFIESFDSGRKYKYLEIMQGPEHHVPDLLDIEEGRGEVVEGATVLGLMKNCRGGVYDFGNGHIGVCIEFLGMNRYFVRDLTTISARGA